MKTFYLASSINTPDSRRGGESLPYARRIAEALEGVTGDRCVSRWLYHKLQNQDGFLPLMATTNILDIAGADYLIFAPLTNSSRGAHVELGLALAMGKPCYIWRYKNRDPVAFDQLCLPIPAEWDEAIERALEGVRQPALCECEEGPLGVEDPMREGRCLRCGGRVILAEGRP